MIKVADSIFMLHVVAFEIMLNQSSCIGGPSRSSLMACASFLWLFTSLIKILLFYYNKSFIIIKFKFIQV